MKFLVLNGPNLNLLGERETEIYGTATLAEIDASLVDLAERMGHELTTFQSNAEHDLVDQVHMAKKSGVNFILINPGAFTHTSIAIRDSMLGTQVPFIEIHLSNVFSREEFRKHSFLSDIAVAVISGLGAYGYELALLGAEHHLQQQIK